MVTYKETRAKLKVDKLRLRDFISMNSATERNGWLCFSPSYQAVFLHRWSYYLFCSGHKLLARLLWHLNLLLTGADISPLSEIDEGLILVHPLGIIIIGKVGKNATFFARGGIGGGLSKKDVGAGPGFPVVGDGVTFEINATVLGPVRIGDNVRVCSGLVTSDIADDMEVQLPDIRIKKISKREQVNENGSAEYQE